MSWIVLSKRYYIRESEKVQIQNMFKNKIEFANGRGNNRKIQPKGDRVVVIGGKPCGFGFAYIIAFVFLYALMMFFIFRLL